MVRQSLTRVPIPFLGRCRRCRARRRASVLAPKHVDLHRVSVGREFAFPRVTAGALKPEWFERRAVNNRPFARHYMEPARMTGLALARETGSADIRSTAQKRGTNDRCSVARVSFQPLLVPVRSPLSSAPHHEYCHGQCPERIVRTGVRDGLRGTRVVGWRSIRQPCTGLRDWAPFTPT
jgi:hypothetical protein